MAKNLVLGQSIAATVVESPRPAWAYERGQRTDQRLRDGVTGASFHRVSSLGVTDALGVDVMTLQLPDSMADVQVGDVLVVAGSQLVGALSGADYGGLRLAISGIESVTRVAGYDEMLRSVAARSTKAAS
ncbi:hypothetical protein [Gordonia sputi]